jgi:hypothetical protein
VPDYQKCIELMEESGQLDQSQEAGDSVFWHRGHTASEIEAHLAAEGNVNFVGAITPLQEVLGDLDTAKEILLLTHGADPNRFDIMWYAVSSASVPLEVVRILVSAGGTLVIGSGETLEILGIRNPERAEAVRKILSGG